MAELDALKRVINESSELSKRGQNPQALKLLDNAIAEAIREKRDNSVCMLSAHASVIADQMGDVALVRHYREQRLARDPENPLALISLADALHEQGEEVLAKKYAAEAYRLSAQRDTELDRGVIDAVLRTWPDLKQHF